MSSFLHFVNFIGILLAICSITINWSNDFGLETNIRAFWQFGFAIGLLLICLSKEKTEHEMFMQIRLNSVFISFFGGIIAHIIFILLDKLAGGDFNSFNSLYLTNFIYVYHFST